MRRGIAPLVAFVGPHNSGKTGLVERLVGAAAADGIRVGVIKRAARALQIDPAGKDSRRFADAGAERVVALGPGRVMMTERVEESPSLLSVCRRLSGGVDLWLAESYMPEPVPWLSVARDLSSAVEVDRSCLATIGFRTAERPSFPIRHTRRILSFILDCCGLEATGG